FVLGEVHWALGEYRTAAELFRNNLPIVTDDVPRGVGPGPVIDSVINRRWLAQVLAELGSFEAALAVGREALHIAEAKNHPYSLVGALTGLGIAMLRSGRCGEAASLFERGVEISRTFSFRDLLSSGLPLLAAAYAQAGRRSDACSIMDDLALIP